MPSVHERPCEKCGGEMRRRVVENRTKWEKRRFCSRACTDFGTTRGRTMSHRGSLHHAWRGGRTPETKRLRNGIEAREWARKVKERDDYTCQMCGARGGRLASDHIEPWALRPDLRYELSNGRTLCWPCHRTTPTFGNKALYA